MLGSAGILTEVLWVLRMPCLGRQHGVGVSSSLCHDSQSPLDRHFYTPPSYLPSAPTALAQLGGRRLDVHTGKRLHHHSLLPPHRSPGPNAPAQGCPGPSCRRSPSAHRVCPCTDPQLVPSHLPWVAFGGSWTQPCCRPMVQVNFTSPQCCRSVLTSPRSETMALTWRGGAPSSSGALKSPRWGRSTSYPIEGAQHGSSMVPRDLPQPCG